jgi:hypothetical protein
MALEDLGMLHEPQPGAPDVDLKEQFCLLPIASLQRVEQKSVLYVLTLEIGCDGQVCQSVRLRANEKALDKTEEPRHCRGGMGGDVEMQVEVHPFPRPSRRWTATDRFHLLDPVTELNELPVRQIGRAKSNREWIESLAQQVDLVELFQNELQHARSRVWDEGDQPFGFQLA